MDGSHGYPMALSSEFLLASRPTAGDGLAARLSVGSISPKEAAQQFEGYFISHLLTVMRQTVPAGPFESKAAQTWYSLYDAEIGRLAAEGGGLGLARALEEMLNQEDSIRPGEDPLKFGIPAADIHNGQSAQPRRMSEKPASSSPLLVR
jgi:Rod binding domain-containing protein